MERIRTTISLPKDVHEVFKRMADVGGVSISRCMGDWLADTSDGAQMVAQKMQQARDSPKLLMREMQAFTAGLVVETESVIDSMRKAQKKSNAGQRDSGARRSAAFSAFAPSSNTGLKSPPKRGGNPKNLSKSRG
jgi:hypothetical protein